MRCNRPLLSIQPKNFTEWSAGGIVEPGHSTEPEAHRHHGTRPVVAADPAGGSTAEGMPAEEPVRGIPAELGIPVALGIPAAA
jgi:hypothetical protein